MNNIIILQGSSRDKQNNYCYADVIRVCHISQAIKDYNFEYYQWVKFDKNGEVIIIKDYDTFYAEPFHCFTHPNFKCIFIPVNDNQVKMIVQYKKIPDFSFLLDDKNFKVTLQKTIIPNTKIYLINFDGEKTNTYKVIFEIRIILSEVKDWG